VLRHNYALNDSLNRCVFKCLVNSWGYDVGEQVIPQTGKRGAVTPTAPSPAVTSQMSWLLVSKGCVSYLVVSAKRVLRSGNVPGVVSGVDGDRRPTSVVRSHASRSLRPTRLRLRRMFRRRRHTHGRHLLRQTSVQYPHPGRDARSRQSVP